MPPETSPDLHQATLRAVLDGLVDPAVAVDGDAVVLAHNAQARALFPGLKADDPLSLAVRDPAVLSVVMGTLARGTSDSIDFKRRVPDDRAFLVHVSPIGRAGVLLTFRDLTEARRLERMRVDFVANASHELRTPLAALLGFIETLEGPARDDAGARTRFLGVMREQAQRMARLIDDLLSLSRVEMAEHRRPETPVDLASIAGQVTDTLRPLADERGVVLAYHAPPAPVVVPGDRDDLLRVADNLIENAIKYGQAGGRVDITVAMQEAAPGGAQAVLTVRDYGAGIAPEHLPRLTERFYRVDSGQSRGQGGTGLGLALVKHIVNRHLGRLAIESRPGEGATFRVVLPVAEPVSPA